MSFRIETRGINEAIKGLDDIVRNIGQVAVGQWFEKIAKAATEICPDAEVEFVRGTTKGDIGKLTVADKKSAECTIKAFERILPQAPEPTKTMLGHARDQIRNRFGLT